MEKLNKPTAQRTFSDLMSSFLPLPPREFLGLEGRGFTGCEKRVSVMLSEAKHLQYLLENTQMQILRFAQDENPGGLFPRPAGIPTAIYPPADLPICRPARAEAP